jgi:hypothetical protein
MKKVVIFSIIGVVIIIIILLLVIFLNPFTSYKVMSNFYSHAYCYDNYYAETAYKNVPNKRCVCDGEEMDDCPPNYLCEVTQTRCKGKVTGTEYILYSYIFIGDKKNGTISPINNKGTLGTLSGGKGNYLFQKEEKTFKTLGELRDYCDILNKYDENPILYRTYGTPKEHCLKAYNETFSKEQN